MAICIGKAAQGTGQIPALLPQSNWIPLSHNCYGMSITPAAITKVPKIRSTAIHVLALDYIGTRDILYFPCC